MEYLQSSQSFVRALKAPNDPPKAGDPLKIEIARQAWDAPSFPVPNKGETIVDWLLTRLLKDRTRAPTSNPVLDTRYWQLLHDVICPPSSPDAADAVRRNKTWLLPLLNRTPIAPTVTSLFTLSQSADAPTRAELYSKSSPALTLLWPLAVQKVMPDALLECFGALLGTLAATSDAEPALRRNEGLQKVGCMLTASMRSAFSNSSNKKKLHQSFIQNHLPTWLRSIAPLPNEDSTTTYGSDIFDAGVDILFSSDTLKQLAEVPASADLFVSLQTTAHEHPSAVLPSLSRLLAAFAHAVRKSRTALFGSGDAPAAEARAAGMRFFVACESVLEQLEGDDVWRARIALLKVVEAEALFGMEQEEAAACLKQVVHLCIAALESPPSGANTDVVFEGLCVLARIDHDLVDASIPSILPHILTDSAPPTGPSAQLLRTILTYHNTTRTLPTHLSRILTSLLQLPPTDHIKTFYTHATASPLLAHPHLDKLARAVRAFLTPGQALDTTRAVLDVLRGAWDAYTAARPSPRKKRRKSAPEQSGVRGDADVGAVGVALATRFVGAVLAALPLRSVPDAVRGEMRAAVQEAFDGFVGDAVRAVLEGEQERDGGAWAQEVVGAAFLRLSYVVEAAQELDVRAKMREGELQMMLRRLEAEETLPELQIELARFLLRRAEAADAADRERVVDAILSSVEKYFSLSNLQTMRWSGQSSALASDEDGRKAAALALFRLILDRCLATLDGFGTPAQRERLVGLILRIIPVAEAGSGAASPAETSLTCLRSANFWEQPGIRASVLAKINARTKILDEKEVTQWLDHGLSQSIHKGRDSPISAVQADAASAAFMFLLHTPIEYLSRSLRGDLLKRAIVLDVILGQTSPRKKGSRTAQIAAVRTFLVRLLAFLGPADHQWARGYLQYLLGQAALNAVDTDASAVNNSSVTLDLIDVHFQTLVRTAEKNDGSDVVSIVDGLLEASVFAQKPPLDASQQDPGAAAAVMRLMTVLTRNYNPASLPPPAIAALKTLFSRIVSQVEPLIARIASLDGGAQTPLEALERSRLMDIWSQCLLFGHWLSPADPQRRDFGRRLAQIVVAAAAAPPSSASRGIPVFGSAALGVLLAELHCSPESDKQAQLADVIAAYVVFSRQSGHEEREEFDEPLRKAARALSVKDFAFALQLILQALSCQGTPEVLSPLVHISILLLHDAPDGTLRIVQEHLNHHLEYFVNNSQFYEGPIDLRSQVLAFVSTQCSDRPASIRSTNLMSIWSLLSKFLSGSQAHDPQTSRTIFEQIITIISALVRLRRDLVLNTLPHLCIALRQLIWTLRSPRPQLGAKQHRLVADTLPMWIHAAQALGADESKALARLLTTLAAKSIVRTHAGHAEAQKPESLARPLSKHVAYVIQAYVEAMNDPLCVLPADVRRELRPGLFVLCDMLNEHGRDALMVSALDAGGKVVMKALWRDYEKQRYVGKG